MMKWFTTGVFCAVAIANAAEAGDFRLTSIDIAEGRTIANKHILNGFGCTGENLSPTLSWSDPPTDTRSYAVTAYDPDAPTGSGWWHWVVLNLPPDTRMLPQGAGSADGKLLPKGAVQSNTDFGRPGWGGPCPPSGDKPHRYVFTVHALKVEKLDLDATAPGAMAGFFLRANTIASASIVALYGR